MRKIKFRMWDKEKHCFYLSSNPYPKNYSDEKRFTVMEFTGLKDKNGIEIFEGDIIGINREKNSIKQPVKFGRYSFQKFIGECGEISDNIELYGFYVENEYLYIQMINEKTVVLGNIFQLTEQAK
ncbi:YopX family protein [Clostridium thailandense]|uniref:YopX protein domain-containing protein n=1 Tax=Clostridium thailandense TaxID=2794346 RepID=A0A949TM37_9CLOT|nr:YopX family protein [Clostridium thailandense]MBV7275394.1 hypothetical protein [Clostridium thailandense]MCH5136108.1 hypothetical protein [Clostridiaceae bacterium UIB06]